MGSGFRAADLVGRFSEAISRLLDAPTTWDWLVKHYDEAAAVIARIRSESRAALHSLAMDRPIP